MTNPDVRSAEIREFLVTAKLAGYATGGEGGERDLADRGKAFHHADGALAYRDRYYGSNPFAGEEVVWHDSLPVWLMNYYGSVTTSDPPAARVFEFLKRAMQRVCTERPFRGPAHYAEPSFDYVDESSGDMDRFIGREIIRFEGEIIYSLHYHGGVVAEP